MLEARDLRVELGGKTILDGIELRVAPGELVGLIGPNGAGKTTLLRTLAGLVAPARGDIRYDSRDLADLSVAERARRIAYLAQNGTAHWPLSVERLVGLGRLPHRRGWRGPDPRDSDVVTRVLAETDVGHLADRAIGTLSGGERVRALLARALAVEAPVLLVDEPVAALDPYHQLEVMALLQATSAAGTAVAAVLHDLTLAARFCDRLVLLCRGRVLVDGAPATVLTATNLADAFQVSIVEGQHEGESYVLPWSRLPAEPDDGR